MLRRIFKLTAPLAIVVLVASLAFGQSRHNRAVVETVKFSHPTIVNGTTIEPAEYRIVAEGRELKVEDLNHNVVARSPITWKRFEHRFRTTKTDIDRGVLTKVNLGQTNEAVLLHTSRTSASAR